MRSAQKKYARGMGHADLQDGRPPRSRAGTEPTDGPVPAETPGEEAPGYSPPPVSGADEAAWRGTDPSADEAAWRGADEAGWRGNGTTDRPAYAAPANGSPGSGDPGLSGGPASGSGQAPDGSRPAPRTGAHRAVRGAEPGPGGPAGTGGTQVRPSGSHRVGGGGQHRQSAPAQPVPGSTPWPGAPVPAQDSRTQPPSRTATGPHDQSWRSGSPAGGPDNGTQPPSRTATGPHDQSWRSGSPAGGPDNGVLPPERAAAGTQDQAWLSSPPPAVPDSGSRLPSRTGPQHSARPTDHRPPATRPGLTRRPTGDGRSLPQGHAATGPQAPSRARPDDPGDAPPGLAITREPPGARRTAPQQASSPKDGRRGPIRGFPPRPGQPDPVYPPGQFSSWNHASTRAAWLGAADRASGTTEAEAEPGYSALALSDAAADLTATQTWAVIDEEPPASPPAGRTRRDWGSHAEDLAPGRPRAADGAPGGAPGGTATGGQTFGPRRGHAIGRPAPGSGDRGPAWPRRTGATRPGTAGAPGTGATGPNATGLGIARRRAGGLGADAAGLGAAGLGAAGLGAAGLGAAAVDAAGPGAAPSALAGAGRPGTSGPGTEAGAPGRPSGPGTDAGAPGRSAEQTGPGGLAVGAGEPGGRVAGRRAADTARQAQTPFDESKRGRPPRGAATRHRPADDDEPAAARHSGRRGARRNGTMAALLLAPVLVVVLVVAGYVYLSSRHAPAAPHAAPPSHPVSAPSSPAPTLGPWKHIESRTLDSVPLTLSELFPAKFTADGQSGTLTVSKEGTKCTHEVIGSKLAKAVRKADCTQVLRASYLSTDHKIMATVGVLNLENATEAGKAGKAAGAVEFIKQLGSKRGPTRNIAKGTGIVAAYVKGHYLILTWTEFANLHAPSGKTKRKQLESFSTGLVAGTANVSLTSRMVTGNPSQPQS
jgi:hypothetical protein